MSTFTRPIRFVSGPTLLVAVSIAVTTAHAYHDTNYWTITLFRRRAGAEFAKTIGTPFTTRARTLPANKFVPLFESARGYGLDDGDEVFATIVSTGTPTLLANAAFATDTQRIVR